MRGLDPGSVRGVVRLRVKPGGVAAVMRRTGRFFRNTRNLSAPYFRSEGRWSAWGLLLLVLGVGSPYRTIFRPGGKTQP